MRCRRGGEVRFKVRDNRRQLPLKKFGEAQVQGFAEAVRTEVLAPGSKFAQLKIGMSAAQVLSMLGQPSDQGAHPTGKAWIPFYFGSDRYRYEVVYKGQGRLLFASGAGFGWDANTHLIWIIHSAAEQGFR